MFSCAYPYFNGYSTNCSEKRKLLGGGEISCGNIYINQNIKNKTIRG